MEKSIKVFLDDERSAPRGWVQVSSAADCAYLLEHCNVTDLSLDHDLGDDEVYGTGYDVLNWLEQVSIGAEACTLPDTITIHSANPVGRKRMEVVIERLKRVRR